MHPSRAHDRIMALIKDTTTDTLKNKLQEDDPRATIPERVEDGIDLHRFSCSPKTGESVKCMIKKELDKRRESMTEFVEVDDSRVRFKKLNAGDPFVLFGIDDEKEPCIKKGKAHAIDLGRTSVRCVDVDAMVKPIELVRVEYKEA